MQLEQIRIPNECKYIESIFNVVRRFEFIICILHT